MPDNHRRYFAMKKALWRMMPLTRPAFVFVSVNALCKGVVVEMTQ